MNNRICLSRRRFLGFSLTAAASGVLAACGSTAAPTSTSTPPTQPTIAPTNAASQEPAAATEPAPTSAPAPTAAAAASGQAIKLEVWHENWGELYNDLMKLIGDEFTKANPDVELVWTFNDDWREKWLTAVASGLPPDCSFIRPWGVAPFALQKAIAALDEYYAESGLKHEDFVTPGIASCLYEGKTYAIPGALDYDFLIYNNQVYRDAGLDPEKPPKTYAEWVEHSDKIYKFSAQGDIERMGMDPRADGLRKAGYMYGGSFYDEAAKKIICNKGGVVEALSWMADNAKKWNPEKVAAFTTGMPSYYQPNSGFATGKQAYLYPGGSCWASDPLDKYAPDLDYGVTFPPTLKDDVAERAKYFWEGWNYGIPTGSKQPKLAWRFLKYAFYDQAALMGVKTLNGCAVIAQLDLWCKGLSDALGANNRMTPYLPILVEGAKVGTKAWPTIPAAARYTDEITRAEDFAVHGAKTAQQALDECAEIVQKELDDALKA